MNYAQNIQQHNNNNNKILVYNKMKKDFLLIFFISIIILLIIIKKKKKENFSNTKTVLTSKELDNIFKSQNSNFYGYYDNSNRYTEIETLDKMLKLNRYPVTNFDLSEGIDFYEENNIKHNLLLKNFCQKKS